MNSINAGGGVQQKAVADLMAQMQKMRQQAQQSDGISFPQSAPLSENKNVKQADSELFSSYLNRAVDSVNSLQKDSAAKATSFELGDRSVSLSEVMIASQKSGIAFQAATQVRNRVVQAYQDVMNMPI